MPEFTSDFLTEQLYRTNQRLHVLLEALAPSLMQTCPLTKPASPQQMAGLLSELMRAGQWLRQLPQTREPELEHEVSRYRENVERLRDLLPSIHSTLLMERSRLEQERARVDAAAEWAQRSRQTL